MFIAIIDFLNQSVADGSVSADDKEGLEIAGMPSLVFRCPLFLTSLS